MAGSIRKAQARQAARRVVRITNRYSTGKEGAGIVNRVSGTGPSAKYQKRVVGATHRELGSLAASKMARSLNTIEKNTGNSAAIRRATRKTARRTAKRI